MSLHDLPALNATLNAVAFVLLVSGLVAIRRKRVALHRGLMSAAFVVSSLFLTSYLIHKFSVGPRSFGGEGWIRPVYFTILLTHTVLAVTIVPLALTTLVKGLKRRHPSHEKWARVTLPLWLYVSVTGVVIYVLLYRMYPAASLNA